MRLRVCTEYVIRPSHVDPQLDSRSFLFIVEPERHPYKHINTVAAVSFHFFDAASIESRRISTRVLTRIFVLLTSQRHRTATYPCRAAGYTRTSPSLSSSPRTRCPGYTRARARRYSAHLFLALVSRPMSVARQRHSAAGCGATHSAVVTSSFVRRETAVHAGLSNYRTRCEGTKADWFRRRRTGCIFIW